jgi:hypothetical protein
MKLKIEYIGLSSAVWRCSSKGGFDAEVTRGVVERGGENMQIKHYTITAAGAIRVFRAIMRLEELRREGVK